MRRAVRHLILSVLAVGAVHSAATRPYGYRFKAADLPLDTPAEVRQLVTDVFMGYQDVDASYNALVKLGRMGEAAGPAVPVLIHAAATPLTLRTSQGLLHRDAAAAETLVQIGRPAVEPLVKVLQDRAQHRFYRNVAARILGRIGGEAARAALVNALSDPDADVRGAVADGLADLGPAAADAVPALIKMLASQERYYHMLPASSSASVGGAVVRALGGIGEPAVDALAGVLDDPGAPGRERAARALALTNHPRAADALLRAAEADDPNLRAIACGAFVNQPPWTPWIEAARLPEDRVVGQKAPGPEPRLADALLAAAKDPYPEVRHAAYRSLTALREPRAAEVFLSALKNEQDRQHGARGAGALKLQQAVKPLCALLKTSTELRVRADAAKALGQIGDPFAIKYLAQAVLSQDAAILRETAPALARFGPAGAEKLRDALLALVGDDASAVQTLPYQQRRCVRALVIALGEAADPRSVELLVKLSASKTRWHSEVGDALRHLTGYDACPAADWPTWWRSSGSKFRREHGIK